MNKGESFPKFYQKLAEEIGYLSEEQARRFYAGFCRLIMKELSAKRRITLPYLGFFYVVPCRNKRQLMPVRGKHYQVPANLLPTVTVRFFVNIIFRNAIKQKFTGHSSYRYKYGPESYY